MLSHASREQLQSEVVMHSQLALSLQQDTTVKGVVYLDDMLDGCWFTQTAEIVACSCSSNFSLLMFSVLQHHKRLPVVWLPNSKCSKMSIGTL